MGAAANGKCYATTKDAADAVCTTLYPQFFTSGTTQYQMDCYVPSAISGNHASLVLRRYTVGTTTSYTQLQAGIDFPTCDAGLEVGNLSEMFVLLAGAVGLVWLAKMVYGHFTTMGAD